jgi:hypothetical protein
LGIPRNNFATFQPLGVSKSKILTRFWLLVFPKKKSSSYFMSWSTQETNLAAFLALGDFLRENGLMFWLMAVF